MALGAPAARRRAARTRVPILGLLQGDDEAELRDDFERLLADGYRTIKVKVGFDVDADLAGAGDDPARSSPAARAIRVDANQGYTADAGGAFIDGARSRRHRALRAAVRGRRLGRASRGGRAAARTGLPLMLDESIYGLADIERAARERACTFIKVKLMKFVGIDALVAAIERIRALGMQPVLGNGVACDSRAGWKRASRARHIDNAGEMNGFLKARADAFRRAARVRRSGDRRARPGFPRSTPTRSRRTRATTHRRTSGRPRDVARSSPASSAPTRTSSATASCRWRWRMPAIASCRSAR